MRPRRIVAVCHPNVHKAAMQAYVLRLIVGVRTVVVTSQEALAVTPAHSSVAYTKQGIVIRNRASRTRRLLPLRSPQAAINETLRMLMARKSGRRRVVVRSPQESRETVQRMMQLATRRTA